MPVISYCHFECVSIENSLHFMYIGNEMQFVGYELHCRISISLINMADGQDFG